MLDLSIIICTRNRSDSLALTLSSLAEADHTKIQYEVIVVDNGSSDETPNVVNSMRSHIPIRYLLEPRIGEYGKGFCLNRALKSGPLGEIIAVIDDDISVDHRWFQGVFAICNRWSGFDFFTGPSHIDFSSGSLPGSKSTH